MFSPRSKLCLIFLVITDCRMSKRTVLYFDSLCPLVGSTVDGNLMNLFEMPSLLINLLYKFEVISGLWSFTMYSGMPKNQNTRFVVWKEFARLVRDGKLKPKK